MTVELKFTHIGLDHIICANRVSAILPPDTVTARRWLSEARKSGRYVEATRGRSNRSVIIMDDGMVIVSCISPKTLLRRMAAPLDEEMEDELPFEDH